MNKIWPIDVILQRKTLIKKLLSVAWKLVLRPFVFITNRAQFLLEN